MKRVLFWTLLLWASAAGAQVVGPGYLYYVTSAPSGACSQGVSAQQVIGTGLIFTCQNGTWAQVGGGSGSGTVGSGTTNQLAIYPSNGTAIQGDTTATENSGILTIGAVGATNNGELDLKGLTSGTGIIKCANATCTSLTTGSAFQNTSASGFTATVGGFNLGATAHILISSTAPTISSGFGGTPSIVASNGPGAFTINVGTGGVATTGVVGLPTAAAGWSCNFNDQTTTSATVFITKQTANTTASVTIGNFNDTTGAAAWAAGDIINAQCFAF